MSKPEVAAAPPRRVQQGARRDAILLAAARLFRERGFDGTTLDDIAGALGLTKPTLYYHIGNKEEILVEIGEQGAAHVMDGVDALWATGDPGSLILRRFMVRYAEWITSEVGVSLVRSYHARMSPENAERIRQSVRLVARKGADIIERGQRDGSIRSCDARLVTNAIFGAFNWLGFWYDPEQVDRAPAELAQAFVEIFLDGIGPSRETRAGPTPENTPRDVDRPVRRQSTDG